MYEAPTTPVIVVLQTACTSNQLPPLTHRYLAEADAQMGGWIQLCLTGMRMYNEQLAAPHSPHAPSLQP